LKINRYDSKILITGATGFVGSYLIRALLQQGYKNIRALKRGDSPMDLLQSVENQISFAVGDILNVPFLESVFENMDYVFHCAATVSFDSRDIDLMYEVNAEGTANVVNLCLATNVKKLIHVSSVAAIGRDENNPNYSEKSTWQRSKWNTHYAISKYMAEQEVWRGVAEGLTAAIVNPSIILGSQFWHQGTGRMFRQVWDGLKFYTSGVTGFVDVRDVVRFMILLMESSVDNQRFILSSENLAYKNLFEQIATGLQKPAPSIHATAFLRGLAWRMDWLKSRLKGERALITKETAMTANKISYYDNRKSKQFFPDFRYTPINNVIQESCEQFLACQKTGNRAAALPII
jgi:dihydroflavonol-4-reductase